MKLLMRINLYTVLKLIALKESKNILIKGRISLVATLIHHIHPDVEILVYLFKNLSLLHI